MLDQRKIVAPSPWLILSFVAALWVVSSLSSCSKRGTNASENSGGNTAQKTFASPEAAGAALFEAAKSGDQNALLGVFGPDGKDLISSGDPVKDKNTLQRFVEAYGRMHRWSKNKGGDEALVVGAENFPFPIPLKQNATGQWSFDTAVGKDELLARRIGNGELVAIGVLTEIANAQQEYRSQTHQFAQKFESDEGQHDGLYWPVSAGQPPSPLGTLGDAAKTLGYAHSEKPQPFNGYYYKMLTAQGEAAKGGAKDYLSNGKLTGGFAVLAWPAKYRDSGIMSFMVGEDGVVYQKDLGEKTGEVAPSITSYNPGEGWNVVLSPEGANSRVAQTAKK
jgi:hypothetical protein